MRVQVNGLFPLIKSTIIEYPNGGEVVATLIYERLEKHFSKCFRLDHELKDCLVAKHQNRARLTSLEQTPSQETSLSKQTPAISDQATYKPRDREPQRDGMYRFSASSTTAPREHWIHREPRENPNLRSYKTQSKVWEERGSQRRSYQARERASKPEERPPRPPRDPKAYRNPTYQGRSYYREVIRKSDQNKDTGSTTSKVLDENIVRGVPLQSDMASIQPEALQRAVGEVRDVMIQYTKSSDPTESAARKERMRQAEEQGEVEETALKIVRANLDAEAEKRRLEEHTTPERIPASQRLSSPSSHRSSRQKSDGQSQNSKSHDRLPASSRLGPVILEQSHNSAERNTTMTERTPPERVPVALRLGTSAELPIPEVIRDAPHKETRRPGRPPGKRTLQNSPRLIAGASSRIRRVAQNKPSPRRKQATEKKTGQKANTNAGTSRRKGHKESSTTSSENRPICNMIPATSRKRMDFRIPSIPGP